jgi:hypothetical protein
MKKTKQVGEVIFEMFKFQYEPLEKRLFKWCKTYKRNDIIKKYKNANPTTKIAVLDKIAQEMNL